MRHAMDRAASASSGTGTPVSSNEGTSSTETDRHSREHHTRSIHVNDSRQISASLSQDELHARQSSAIERLSAAMDALWATTSSSTANRDYLGIKHASSSPHAPIKTQYEERTVPSPAYLRNLTSKALRANMELHRTLCHVR
jgi:hypothetical protein